MGQAEEDHLEEYCWENQRKNVPYRIHQVPGLRNICKWRFTTSYLATPMHYHLTRMEFHCVVKGQRQFRIDDDRTIRRYTLSGSEGILFFPMQKHCNGPSPQMPGESYVFQLDFSNPNHLLGMDGDYSRALYQKMMHLDYQTFRINREGLHALAAAFQGVTSQDPEEKCRGVQYLTSFLFSLPDHGAQAAEGRPAIDGKIEKSLDYLQAHLREPVQLKEMAAAAGYSVSYFKARFREEIGITPASYMMRQRMESARHTLEESAVTVVDLAEELGFSSSEYFCSVFKKYYHTTPTEYRCRAQSVPLDWDLDE